MTRWIVINRKLIETHWFTVGSCGLAAMLIINIFLLQRLIQADFQNNNNKNKMSRKQVSPVDAPDGVDVSNNNKKN